MKSPANSLLYALPSGWRIAQLEDRLPYAFEAAGTTRSSVQLLDSFDWRLFGAGTVLTAETDGRQLRLQWVRSDSQGQLSILLPRMPRFAWDLPQDHSLRGALEPLLEMRTLLPMVRVEVARKNYNLLNRDGKTVLRLQQESLDNDAGAMHLLRVRQMRGYPKPFSRVTRLLDEVATPLSELELAEQLVVSGGVRPLDYNTKVVLKPEQTAADAMRALFLDLLAAMERNFEGTLKDWDSEFLHDFRVAVRRTRSGIAQVRKVFAQESLLRYGNDFAWLGTLTGPTRDLDVYLLKFNAYQQRLPASSREDLLPFRDFLVRRQAAAQKALTQGLKSSRYRDLLTDWQAFLYSPPAAALDSQAGSPVREVASRQILRLYRRAMKEGAAITDLSPPDALHDLRKTCKKLRYLLEFFRSLYEREKMQRLIRSLKQLQDNLGDFQDYEVQAASLRTFGRQMLEEGIGSAETMMAMGVLVVELERQQMEARRKFAGRFAKFAKPEVRGMFREMFGKSKLGGEER